VSVLFWWGWWLGDKSSKGKEQNNANLFFFPSGLKQLFVCMPICVSWLLAQYGKCLSD
jgi:hypothetical protein